MEAYQSNNPSNGARKRDNSGKFYKNMLHLKRYGTLYLLLIIPFAQILLFRYTPMINILAGFKKNQFLWPLFERPWADNYGFEFFIKAFQDQYFLEALRNTFMLNILDLVLGFPIPIILALLLNELRYMKFKRFTQTVLYMPHFLSWVIIASLATQVFASRGIVNNFLGTSIPFLQSPINWVFTYIFVGIWASMGWNTIIYLASITAINPELYEAAAVDGAKRFRMMWHVTLPGIRPVIVILLILSLGRILGTDFERIMAMRNPLVFEYSDTISVYVYNMGIRGMQQSLAAAVGLFQSVVSVVFLLMANTIAKRFGERGIL
ncbi:MAG: ABC transporter permease subunit [Defluviitaleaceae bacterium]|nr:ABC transporter permease subunit [Defluviitaleaceae bacterium]MCL2835804.1 ABC transporter permease subunit [Defluviitaleaceae bacterium]